MKNYIKKISIGFVILFAFMSFYCVDNKGKDNIKIGSTLDFTGTNALYGEQVKQGIDLAVEEINKNGGINKKNIQIIYLDSKSEPKIAVTNAQRFLNVDGAKIIIGEISSDATYSMIPVVEQNNAFLFAPASSGRKLTNASKNFARNWPSDVAEAGNAADFAFNVFKSKNPIVVYVNSEYGIGLKNMFEETFTKLGGKVIGTLPFELNTSNFRTLLIKLKQYNFDCLYLAGNPKEMGNFMNQWGESGLNANIISNSGFIQPDCINLSGKYADGIVIPTPSYNPDDTLNIKAIDFNKKFQAKYNKKPTLTDANAYDAIYLIKEAIEKVDLNGIEIGNYIRNLKNYKGVSGEVSFTNGDVERKINYKVVKNGEVVDYKF
jgi:branched-chain amino acid transport system substrate-binding protein